ncbi:D-alanyl-D-alanine carboxypeptidase DacC precursor [Poriferisphaera corsica]|uniref:D-alanyl-D-alanine carboxypeptidase DacC n=1 Tax=Poriferisphaera corsica TaxID=2528020 RepID=A0A517YYF6_9BACT|nr:D-alanyl-D-alanine carboxypeptidase/D-alanyl-D-alanine-endopeptidase [Poriferisphaera corsica]QDU35248.1 D-alanyl-D-alanine carboxypeptidase DacC precursor [Poriferisphaera corsica]
MTRNFFKSSSLFALLLLLSFSTALSAQTTLSTSEVKEKLDAIFNQEKFANAFWGITVETIDGDIIYQQNRNKQFTPASNMKIFTSAATLDTLGSDFRYETKVDAVGSIRNGALNGDLVIVGSADPSLGAWHPAGNTESTALFAEWARQIKEAGIDKVYGRIIGDPRILPVEYYNGDWSLSDIPYWYAAGSSGLNIEENTVRIYIAPGKKVGDKPILRIVPDTDYINIVNKAKTVSAGQSTNADVVWRDPESNTVIFSGNVALDKKEYRERASIWNSPKYAAHLFKQALLDAGVEVQGKASNIRDLKSFEIEGIDSASKRTTVITHVSPSLHDLAAVVNKPSHNLFADLFGRTLAINTGKSGSFASAAIAVKEWFKSIDGPQPDAVNIYDGSGLSSRNNFQPRQMVHLLRYMATDSKAKESFIQSLPIAGVDGSLGRRLKNSPARGKVRAKTGYISYARTLSGYIESEAGQPFIFSFMCNNYTVPTREVNAAQDAACAYLFDPLGTYNKNKEAEKK